MKTRRFFLLVPALLALLPALVCPGCGGGGSGAGGGGNPGGGGNTNPPPANPPPMGTATLTWNKVPGIVKYRVYWGTNQADLANSVTLEAGAAGQAGLCNSTGNCTYTLTLPKGTYYFSVTSIDNADLESNYSNEKSKTIP